MPEAPRTGCIQVQHGKLTLQVPRDMFVGEDFRTDHDREVSFRETTRSRYPWLTDNGLDVILRNARRVMRETVRGEERGPVTGRRFLENGEAEKAVSHMRSYLADEPDDADGWYVLGEALCRTGRSDEGYQAFNRGRSLF